jgi:hypothetical protein
VSADLLFNFTPPDPIHVRTFGRHDLSGPGADLSRTRRSSRAHFFSPLFRPSKTSSLAESPRCSTTKW